MKHDQISTHSHTQTQCFHFFSKI